MENGFQGLDGQTMPVMDDDFLNQVTDRYIELYETITGKKFEKGSTDNIEQRIMENTVPVLEKLV